MIHTGGYICILIALLASLAGGALSLLHLRTEDTSHPALVEKAQWAVSAFLFLAAALLLHALFWENYNIEYVASYTDKFLPLFYRLTAFWAGQPGSMLFWAVATSFSLTIFALTHGYRTQPTRTRLWFWAFSYTIMSFFCLVLTAWSNPFMAVEPAPLDGSGLNPLLQNPGMIFHPPLLFLGYAGFTVPACLALAQLLDKNESQDWPRATRAFYMTAWAFLSAGIVLGAWWAYMELGWGGYWAWDPVENSSLLPWLIACAAIHIISIQQASGKLARTSACLMALTVISAFFATYLTRSGIIQSVHAFGDGGVGTPLTIFVSIGLILSLSVPLTSKSTRCKELASPLSREGALMLAAWIFLALAAIIGVATMWPVISKLWTASPQGLDASFYNRVCLPITTGLLLLLCVCFWLRNQGGLAHTGYFYATCGAFVASGIAIWLAGYRHPLPLVASAAAIASICAMFMQIPDCIKIPRKLAATTLHFGLALLALGVAFSGPYTTDRELLLSRAQQEVIGPYVVSLENVRDGRGQGYDFLQATLKISRNGEILGTLTPERRIYDKFGDMQFSEVDVISSLSKDIYASLLGMDEDMRVLVKISIEPLVNLIWIGGAILCIAPFLGLGRRKTKNV